jgi:hypothetical protein
MALADDLARERAALTMIHAQPFNAEAPPEALQTDITPSELHYIRSNFPSPTTTGGSRSAALSRIRSHSRSRTCEQCRRSSAS